MTRKQKIIELIKNAIDSISIASDPRQWEESVANQIYTAIEPYLKDDEKFSIKELEKEKGFKDVRCGHCDARFEKEHEMWMHIGNKHLKPDPLITPEQARELLEFPKPKDDGKIKGLNEWIKKGKR